MKALLIASAVLVGCVATDRGEEDIDGLRLRNGGSSSVGDGASGSGGGGVSTDAASSLGGTSDPSDGSGDAGSEGGDSGGPYVSDCQMKTVFIPIDTYIQRCEQCCADTFGDSPEDDECRRRCNL